MPFNKNTSFLLSKIRDDDRCFTATFVRMVGWMGRATYKGNEANWKMKYPSDIDWPVFEPRCYRYVANHATS